MRTREEYQVSMNQTFDNRLIPEFSGDSLPTPI